MTTQDKPILVVDDDPDMVMLLQRILQQEGFTVETAYTGEEALAKSRDQELQLALLDVMLPGMDGYTLCRQLRQQPHTQYLPVLMLTARGDIADKIAGFESGADDYLTKPFQPKELVYRLRSLLTRTQSALEPDTADSPHQAGRIVALFSSKGGVGKTTIATNLSVCLQQMGHRVALVDADFFFGDVGVHLNLPSVRTVLDLLDDLDTPEAEQASQVLIPHSSGVRVLLSPLRPEDVRPITTEQITSVLDLLAGQYDFVIADCQLPYDDRMRAVLTRADDVLLIVTPEIGPLKNTSRFLDWMSQHGYPLDKINVLLNRFNSNVGIGPEEIERTLQHEVTFRLISGGRPVVLSVNRGIPLVIQQPDHPFCQQIQRIADFYAERLPAASNHQTPGPS